MVNGFLANEKVNVMNSVSIGQCLGASFVSRIPSLFHKPVGPKVITMQVVKKGLKIGDETIYDFDVS